MDPGRGVPQGDGGDDGGYDDRATQRRLLPLRHHLQHQSGESKEILPTSLGERAGGDGKHYAFTVLLPHKANGFA